MTAVCRYRTRAGSQYNVVKFHRIANTVSTWYALGTRGTQWRWTCIFVGWFFTIFNFAMIEYTIQSCGWSLLCSNLVSVLVVTDLYTLTHQTKYKSAPSEVGHEHPDGVTIIIAYENQAIITYDAFVVLVHIRGTQDPRCSTFLLLFFSKIANEQPRFPTTFIVQITRPGQARSGPVTRCS